MKTLFALLLLSTSALAGTDLALQWDDSQAGVTYNVYEQVDPLLAPNKVGSATVKTFTIKGITKGAHTYYVTASNGAAESAPSNLLVIPAPVTNLRAVFTITVP